MKLRIFIEPQQGADFATQARVAQATEELGFDAFFRSDHFLAMGQDGRPGPTDSWVTLGALALQTSRIRLGTMVTAATFRRTTGSSRTECRYAADANSPRKRFSPVTLPSASKVLMPM